MLGGDEPAEVVRTRWRCPICGTSQTYLTSDENAAGKARSALSAHVRAQEDAVHGLHYGYPEGFDPEALDPYVEVTPTTGDRVDPRP